MEAEQFDDLTKRLGRSVSRRTALTAALAASVGGMLGIGSRKRAEAAVSTCPPGYVRCNGTCFPDNPTSIACGGVCCQPGQVCAGGKCCSGLQACGTVCCPSGQICKNGVCIFSCLQQPCASSSDCCGVTSGEVT